MINSKLWIIFFELDCGLLVSHLMFCERNESHFLSDCYIGWQVGSFH